MGSAALSGGTFVTATGGGAGTPGPAASSWRCRSCDRAATSPTGLLERRRRAESALVSVVATSYLLGVSTRRMEKLVQTLGITGLSKSQVSEMAKDLDSQVEAFRTRPLDAGPYTFVAADALVLKVREAGRTVNVHALLATGVNADGYREILGLHLTSAEDGAGWLGFFRDLTARGLSGVALVTSDAHRGLVEAIGATLPGAAWQRCRTHYAANLMSATPKNAWGWVKALLHSVYDQPDAAAVHAQFDRILDALIDKLPRRRRTSRCRPGRHLGIHQLPQSHLAPDLVQQPPATTEPRDPPPHRRRRHLSRPDRPGPPGRRRARRTTRRMDRDAPLHRPGHPRKSRLTKITDPNPTDPEVTITAITA
jgi:putative transposase